ncbi:MAG: HD domain-containing protein [Candidatus Micrarchaeota archaeon]
MAQANSNNIANFLFEIGDLKRISRSGWWHCKINDPESVADHSFRTALIAYALAKKENSPNPEKVAFSALVHDLPEARLTDLHKLSASYIKNKKEIEAKIFKEQQSLLGFEFPKPTKSELMIIKDADLLELAFSAKEYEKEGYKETKILFNRVKKQLKSGSSRSLFSSLEKTAASDWWATRIQ